jgi:hypothetical protein
MSAKEFVLQAIHRLPDDADYRAIAEEVAFLAALEQGDQDIQAGRTALCLHGQAHGPGATEGRR